MNWRCSVTRLMSTSALIAVLQGCSSVGNYTRSRIASLRRPKTSYRVAGFLDPARPENMPIAEKSQPIKIELVGIAINDQYANDMERALLQEAGVAARLSDGAATDAKEDAQEDHEFFSYKFKTKVGRAIGKRKDEIKERLREARRKVGDLSPIGDDAIDQIKHKLYTDASDRLKARYKVVVEVEMQSFDYKSQTFHYEAEFEQNAIESVKTIKEDWRKLLYRGSGADIITITVALQRTSMIAEAFQRRMQGAKESDLFADAFAAAFAGASEGVLRDLGRTLGARVDAKLVKYAKKHYEPTFELAKASFRFMTKQGDTVPHEDGLYLGTRILSLGVIPEGKSSKQSVLVTRLAAAKQGE